MWDLILMTIVAKSTIIIAGFLEENLPIENWVAQ